MVVWEVNPTVDLILKSGLSTVLSWRYTGGTPGLYLKSALDPVEFVGEGGDHVAPCQLDVFLKGRKLDAWMV